MRLTHAVKAGTLALLTVLATPATEAQASAWIGCDACNTSGIQISPSCSMCSTPAMPTVPNWGTPQLPYCPQCMAQQQQMWTQPPMNPWWAGYQPNYWNFYMPGPYNGMGMMPQYFPAPPYFPPQGGGGVYMAKPVVYVRGPKGARVEIGVTPAKGEVVVAVPALREWKAELQGTEMKTSEGKYGFFFYDAWMDHTGMQDERGTCGNRADALTYMENLLKQGEFPAEAIQDFRATWSIKLPHQQELCVYPQTEEQLQTGVRLTFKPERVRLTQLEFVIVPKRFFGSAEAKTWPKFAKAPKAEFSYRKPASAPPSAKDEIRAFDWGVGFLRMEK